MNIIEISKMPTIISEIPAGKLFVDESALRSFQILEKIKEMVARGDSKETILEIIKTCEGI